MSNLNLLITCDYCGAEIKGRPKEGRVSCFSCDKSFYIIEELFEINEKLGRFPDKLIRDKTGGSHFGEFDPERVKAMYWNQEYPPEDIQYKDCLYFAAFNPELKEVFGGAETRIVSAELAKRLNLPVRVRKGVHGDLEFVTCSEHTWDSENSKIKGFSPKEAHIIFGRENGKGPYLLWTGYPGPLSAKVNDISDFENRPTVIAVKFVTPEEFEEAEVF
jgi:hypothetical protein